MVGDTPPAIVDDTAGYPTAIIAQIFQDLEASDSYCCKTSWDGQCVAEVSSVCGESCSSGGVCGGGGGGGGTCAHAECSTGAKLKSGCDACVTKICGEDSYCCGTSWDSVCVAEVGSVCDETCP